MPPLTHELHGASPPSGDPFDARLAALYPRLARTSSTSPRAYSTPPPERAGVGPHTARHGPGAAPDPPGALLSLPGVAARLGVSTRTVERHVAAGRLRPAVDRWTAALPPDTVDAFVRAAAAGTSPRTRRSSTRRAGPRERKTNPRARGRTPAPPAPIPAPRARPLPPWRRDRDDDRPPHTRRPRARVLR